MIDERYQISKLMGCWRIGWVYEVEELKQRELRCLICMRLASRRTSDYLRWLQSERHRPKFKQILAPLDGGQLGGDRVYLITQLPQERSLWRRVQEEGAESPIQVCVLGLQLLRLLSRLQERGLLLGDLRPRTLFLPEEGALPQIFTPGFERGLSPLLKDPLPLSSEGSLSRDLQSLGALLYFQLAGRPPPSVLPGQLIIPPSWSSPAGSQAALLDSLIISLLALSPPPIQEISMKLRALKKIYGLSQEAWKILGFSGNISTSMRDEPKLLHKLLGV